MCKKAYCLIVLLFGSTWAQAQQSQPGYAVLTPDPGSVRAGTATVGNPPEPGALGGLGAGPMPGQMGPGMGYPMAPGGYIPGAIAQGPGMGAQPAMGGPGMGGNPPMMTGPGMGMPVGTPGVSMPPEGYGDGSSIPVVGPTAMWGTETFWFQLGYAAGWLQKPRLGAPLITEGSASDAHPGSLGQPGTVVAFGDQNYKFGTYHGLNAQIGVNLTEQLSIELNSQIFPSQHVSWTTASDGTGNPLIARPVFSVLDGQERSYLTSLPGVVAGSTSVEARSELWGAELVGRYQFKITPYLYGDLMLGYRRMELLENLTISDQLTPLQPSITFLGNQITPNGTANYITDYDHFATNNTFNGVDFGGRFRWQSGFDWFSVTGYWKEALGITTQTVNINGATTLVTPGSAITAPGGILAQLSNGGNFTRSVFGAITEGGVDFTFVPCKYVRFDVGYSATYWNSVVRPGNQINHNVTSSQVPTDINYTGSATNPSPTFGYKSQGLVFQTLNLGLTLYY